MKQKFTALKKSKNAIISFHTNEMLKKRKIDESDVLEALFSGQPIEYQNTNYEGECKIIFRSGNFDEKPLHIIVLFSDFSAVAKIVTVYNPTVGHYWKWDETYSKRIYLNEFRTCCIHPLDSPSNHDKAHHERPYHPPYYWKHKLK